MNEGKQAIRAPRPQDAPEGAVGYVIYAQQGEPGRFTKDGQFVPGRKKWVEKERVYFDRDDCDE